MISTRTCEFFYLSFDSPLSFFVTRGRVTAKLGGVDSSNFDHILPKVFYWFLFGFDGFPVSTNTIVAKTEKLCFLL